MPAMTAGWNRDDVVGGPLDRFVLMFFGFGVLNAIFECQRQNFLHWIANLAFSILNFSKFRIWRNVLLIPL